MKRTHDDTRRKNKMIETMRFERANRLHTEHQKVR